MNTHKVILVITLGILMTGCNSPEKEGKKYAEKICELGKKITSNSSDMGLQEQYDSLTKVITTKVLSYSPDDKVKWETGYNEGIKECGMNGGSINTGGDKYVGLWVDIHGTGKLSDTVSVSKPHDNEYHIGGLQGTLTQSNGQEYIKCNFNNQVEVQFIYDNTTSHLMMRSPVNNVEYKKVRDTPRTQVEEEMNSKRQETEKSKNGMVENDSVKNLRRILFTYRSLLGQDTVLLHIQKIDTNVTNGEDSVFGVITINKTQFTFRTTGHVQGMFFNTTIYLSQNHTEWDLTMNVNKEIPGISPVTGVITNKDNQQSLNVNFSKR